MRGKCEDPDYSFQKARYQGRYGQFYISIRERKESPTKSCIQLSDFIKNNEESRRLRAPMCFSTILVHNVLVTFLLVYSFHALLEARVEDQIVQWVERSANKTGETGLDP